MGLVPTIENGQKLFVQVYFFCFLFLFFIIFSTQNQVPQIIFGLGSEMSDKTFQSPLSRDSNHIKKSEIFFLVSRKTVRNFWFLSILNLSPKNLVLGT